MAQRIRWGILGTGNIANIFAKAIRDSLRGTLVAVASRDGLVAERFAEQHAVAKSYGSYAELLCDTDIDVVYIALPHHVHAEWSIHAARAKKHILCEKPCAINYATAVAVIDEVRKHDVFYMEAFMYRCHQQTKKIIELIQNKHIGDVRFIEASFCYHAMFRPEEIAHRKMTGGGGILDVGCYPVSMARLIAGIENGTDAILPIDVQGMAHIDSASESDEWAMANFKFPGDILAHVSTATSVEHRNDLRIFGSRGSLHIPSPWVPGGRDPGVTSIFVKTTGDRNITDMKVETTIGLYAQEVDTVCANLQSKEAAEMRWQDTLANMKTLELWRTAVGMPHLPDSYADHLDHAILERSVL